MIEVFLIAAVLHWVAAPDRFTAGARTAAGTGLRAAGSGLRDHWAKGREGRQMGRTARRDRWNAKGGWLRRLLGLEHAAVVTGKTAKGAGRLAVAAAKPVPGAIRDGWRRGQDRHRARAQGKRAGLVLDPPWWRKPDPAPVPEAVDGTAPEDSPTPVPGQPTEQDSEVLDSEEDIRARRSPWWNQSHPEPLTDSHRRFWTYRDAGFAGPLDQDGRPVTDGSFPFPPPTDQPAGASPAGTPTPIPTPGGVTPDTWSRWATEDMTPCPRHGRSAFDASGRCSPSCGFGWETDPLALIRDNAHLIGTDNPGGTVSPTPFGAELDDLTSVQDFAVKVADMAEESDFAQLVEFCKRASDETRDFGADMAADVAEFEEIASKIGELLSELVDAAQHVRDRSAELIGG